MESQWLCKKIFAFNSTEKKSKADKTARLHLKWLQYIKLFK